MVDAPVNAPQPVHSGTSMSTLTTSTSRAQFAIGDEQIARRVVDLLTESFFEDQAAVAAFADSDGRWTIAVNFADPPDQAAIRHLVTMAAGETAAATIVFDTVEAK